MMFFNWYGKPVRWHDQAREEDSEHPADHRASAELCLSSGTHTRIAHDTTTQTTTTRSPVIFRQVDGA